MGNSHSTSHHAPTSLLLRPGSGSAGGSGGGADSFLGELGSAVLYEKSMGSSRFLKTIRGRHRQGALVVKVFVKAEPSVSLKQFTRRIKAEREALLDCPNVLSYQRALETERAGYLIRQWIASNLYDRISTRPFLSLIEKRWIGFQLLTALAAARERGVSHGDIKTENVLVTSWNWVYLTDFSSSLKPVFLPLDDPSTFSYYFDTSSRRTCYLAPERFYAPDSDIAKRKDGLEFGKRDGKLTEAMDVFSLGCVFAELWMEGTPIFSLSQLFKYSAGEYSPEPFLAEIEDVEIRDLIRSMISLDPAKRQPFSAILAEARGTCFPDIFYSFLHPFVSSLNQLSHPHQPPPSTPQPQAAQTGTTTPQVHTPTPLYLQQQQLSTEADDKIERVWTEWEMIQGYLDEEKGLDTPFRGEDRRPSAAESSKMGRRSAEVLFPIKLDVPGLKGETAQGGAASDGPALIVLALLCSNMRNCLRPGSILRTLDLLLAISSYLTDETKLDRLVPYLVACLQDDNPLVRSSALKTLTQTLASISSITPSNGSIFSEYILPNTRPFSSDPELLPRVTYAQCITPLARTAGRFLEMNEALKASTAASATRAHEFDHSSGVPVEESSGDQKLSELHSIVQEHIAPLLSDSSAAVKRALLSHVGTLCVFFGRQKASDAILAHLVTYLNTRDWQLRQAWNRHALDVAACVGRRALEEYILPLIVLSLADSEEFVVSQVLETLSRLAEKKLIQKGKQWELVNAVTGFLFHPNIWIREGAAAFLERVALNLHDSDKWAILYPLIRKLLRADIKDITALAILENAHEPIPRNIFEAAVSWAGRDGRKSLYWTGGVKAAAKGAPRDASVRTEEDNAQLDKLRALGMRTEDESKLGILKSYILKLAQSRQAAAAASTRAGPDKDDPSPALMSAATLAELGVVPQTIIFSIKQVDDPSQPGDGTSPRASLDGAGAGALMRRFSLEPGTPRSPASIDFARPGPGGRVVSAGQPIDDLRRRLALANVSSGRAGSVVSSVHDDSASQAGQHTGADSPTATTPSPAPGEGVGKLQEPFEIKRTISRTSTTTDDSSEPAAAASGPATPASTARVVRKSRSRVHLNSVEVGRVTAAVGEDSTNVMGLFNVDSRYNRDDDAQSAITGLGDLASPYAASTRDGALIKRGAEVPRQRFVSTYEGHDPSITRLIERVFQESYKQPTPELGPHVAHGIPRRKALRSAYPPRERTATRPEGTLVAHLTEHTAAIVAIAVAPSQLFFATASEDGTVKVWDTIRLEKNVTSKARQTISHQDRAAVTAVCSVEGTHCLASASVNGQVLIHRVDVTLGGSLPKYASKPMLVRQTRTSETAGEHTTALASYSTPTSTNLVLGTSLGKVVLVDIRTMAHAQSLQNPLQFGPVTSLCLDRKRVWLVAATARGVLTLWDLRFGLLLRSWKVGRGGKVHKVEVHPTRGKGRWVVVAVEGGAVTGEGEKGKLGDELLEVWDVDQGKKVEEFRSVSAGRQSGGSALSTGEEKMLDAELDPAAAIEALLASANSEKAVAAKSPAPAENDAPAAGGSRPGVRTFVLGTDYSASWSESRAAAAQHGLSPSQPHGQQPHHGQPEEAKKGALDGLSSGYILMGGEDRKLRFWDLAKVGRSVIVSGAELEDDQPAFTSHMSSTRPSLFLESPSHSTQHQPSRSSSSRHAPSAGPAKVHRSTLIANSQQQLLRQHQEAITAVAVVDLPFRCVVTGDRMGTVRVFE